MTLYELYYTHTRQNELLAQAKTDRWLNEFRAGHPSLGQRMAINAGEALVRAGGWLKRQGAGRSYSAPQHGLPVPR